MSRNNVAKFCTEVHMHPRIYKKIRCMPYRSSSDDIRQISMQELFRDFFGVMIFPRTLLQLNVFVWFRIKAWHEWILLKSLTEKCNTYRLFYLGLKIIRSPIFGTTFFLMYTVIFIPLEPQKTFKLYNAVQYPLLK